MTMRYFVLVTYDISDNKRLNKVFKLLRGYGDHVQYSVFLCQLSEKDKVVLMEKIIELIKHTEDQVILITLGRVDGKRQSLPMHWDVLGKSFEVPDRSVMIY